MISLKSLLSFEVPHVKFIMNARCWISAGIRHQRRVKRVFIIGLLLFAVCSLLTSCAGLRGDSKLVQPIDENGLQQLIAQARGNVVLLNFWATWCEPCVEEFPALIKISQQFQPQGLQVVFVSIDEPEDIGSKVLPFLKAQGVVLRTYIKRTKDDEAFINAIDVKWSGAIPATFIYNTDGTLVQRLVAQQSFEKFAEAIQPLLPNGSEMK
jgi:thiol-disulfide isomerase/thioredoxin